MTRTLSITAAEWASVQDGTMWLVRDGGDCIDGEFCYAEHDDNAQHLPVEFVQACAPCEMCHGSHTYDGGEMRDPIPCPDCHIELVGPCPTCGASGTYWNDHGVVGYPMEPLGCHDCEATGVVTLGHAYAVGEPLPIWHTDLRLSPTSNAIVVAPSGIFLLGRTSANADYDLTDRLANYGPPESLVGRWALQVRVVGS